MDAALLFAPISTEQPIPSQTVTAEVHGSPSASFTPTVSGTRPSAQPELQVSLVVVALILEAIRQGIAQGLQQRASSEVSSYVDHLSCSQGSRDLEESTADQDRAHSPSSASQASQSEEREIPLDPELSDDDGLETDQLSFVGLFRPQLFHSLLFKAQTTTHLGTPHSMGIQPLPWGIPLPPCSRNQQCRQKQFQHLNCSLMWFFANGPFWDQVLSLMV